MSRSNPTARRLGIGIVSVGLVFGFSAVSAPTAEAATAYTTAVLNVRAGTSTATQVLTSIPANATINLQCQAKGQAVQGTYNSDWWGKVTWAGRTGYVSRAYVRVPVGQNVPTCGAAAPSASATTTASLTVRASTTTSSAALTVIPANTAIKLACQAKGQAIRGTYNSDWWGKVTWAGKTGYVSRAYVRVPVGVSVPTCAGTPAPAPAPGSSIGGTIARSTVIARAKRWVNLRVPYSMSRYTGDGDGHNYRTDCSGMVSMALHLNSSLSTVTLPNVVYRINKNDLRAGDIVGNLGAGTGGASGHVVIFNGWVDSSRTRFHTLEQTGGVGAQATIRTWGASFYTKAAYRYNKITG